jgi:hypothetical protein
MSITRHIGKNSGSLRSIKIIPFRDVTSTPMPVDLEVKAVPTVTGTWIDIEFLPGEASWQENVSDTDNGPVYTYLIQCQVNKDRLTINRILHGITALKIIADIIDQNGTRRLIGEKTALNQQFAKLTYSLSKELKTGRNSYDISISFQSGEPVPELNPA